jgi:hypothetical protein
MYKGARSAPEISVDKQQINLPYKTIFFYGTRVYEEIKMSQQNSSNVTFFNITASPRDDRDMNVDMVFELPLKYPRSLDWTKHLQEIRNQGVQGTSLAQVGACMLEWKGRKLNKENVKMSPQFLYNNRENQKNVFMCGRDLMHMLKHTGCCTETACPYGSQELNTNVMMDECAKYKINGYVRIQTIETLKMSLYVFGPALITFPVFNHTTCMWKQHKEEQKLGGHAMAVVGYNSKGFILRNSWGKYWEKTGYCIYPYEDWGYHDEAWCIGDQESYDAWKQKPRNMLTKAIKKHLSTKAEIVGDSIEKAASKSAFVVSQFVPLPKPRNKEDEPTDSNDVTYGTSFKDKENVKMESNSMKKTNMFSNFFRPNKKEEPAPATEEPAPATEEPAPATEEPAPATEEPVPDAEEAPPAEE